METESAIIGFLSFDAMGYPPFSSGTLFGHFVEAKIEPIQF
jgi:hypothetical protein